MSVEKKRSPGDGFFKKRRVRIFAGDKIKHVRRLEENRMFLRTVWTRQSKLCRKTKRFLAKWMFISIFVLSPGGTSIASTPSPEKGKEISGQCAACHGNQGKAVNTSYPNLAGQNFQYLVQALEKFKNGQRHNSIMQSIASGLSQEQINDLAAFYANIPAADCTQH
jgi:cytochrome c553